MQEIQALLQNHLIVERWNKDMEILKEISDAFRNRDLSAFNLILEQISFYSICMID